MARRAVFIVFNVVGVVNDDCGSAGHSAVWTVRPRATVRKLNSMHNAQLATLKLKQVIMHN